MKHVVKQLSLITASVVMVLGFAVVPVSAHNGSDYSSDDDSSSSSKHRGNLTSDVESEDDNNSSEHNNDAERLLQAKRKGKKQHSYAERQKSCVARQKNIAKRTDKFATNAEKHLEVFDKIFTRAQNFHDSKQLNVDNYDALVAAAATKRAVAQAAVNSLSALDTEIDCTQADPAESVAVIKTVVINARTALKEYRSAIKDLIVALKGASTAQNTTTEGETEGEQ